MPRLVDVTAVFAPGVSACVWRRRASRAVARYVHERALAAPISVRAVVAPGASVAGSLDAALPSERGRALFLEDVRFLVEVFSELVGAELVGVRLARLEAPMCPRWHTDRVLLRLVCTYVGPGTELCEPDAEARGPLLRGEQTAEALRAPVVRVSPFDVAFLKGEAWPGNEGAGAVHRSPPHGAGAPRLVLTLDALDAGAARGEDGTQGARR